MVPYLVQLTMRLSAGLGNVPDEAKGRHVAYTLAAQQPDGGFAGREGGSDLYYTSFAMRSLAILGQLTGTPAEQAAAYLRGRLSGRETIVDFLSLIYAAHLLDAAAGIDIFATASGDWRAAVATAMESLRRDDGGYAKGPEGSASSTYHTFLVLICLQLLEREMDRPQEAISFLLSQRGDDGGFREIRAQKRAGTNPTAAAIAALNILDGLTDDIREETIDFLVDMQTDEGGLRANTRIPIADLLSTFTGCLTLTDLGALDEIDVAAAHRYGMSLELPDGGFHGAAWDTASDVEYTFYGLATQAILGRAE